MYTCFVETIIFAFRNNKSKRKKTNIMIKLSDFHYVADLALLHLICLLTSYLIATN